MKYIIFTLAAATLTVCTAFSAVAQAPALEKMDAVQRALPDGPVALVDGKAITKDDYLFLYKSQLARIHLASGGKKLGEDVRVKAGISTLAELIQREVLVQLGMRRKLDVPQSAVKEAYAKQLELLRKEFTVEGKVPTEEEILLRSGQEHDGALEDMHKALLVEKASKALAEDKGLTLTDKEAREFYDENKSRFQRPGMLHLKQIFVRVENPGTADDASWDKAEAAIKKAVARIQVGESFEGVAKSMSNGQDAEQGGDMQMRPTQSIPPVYVDKAGTMKDGETSEPFKSDQGWHIIRLIAREGESDVTFDDAKDWIKERLMQVKIAAAVEEYCQPILADDNRVQIFLQLRPPAEEPAKKKS